MATDILGIGTPTKDIETELFSITTGFTGAELKTLLITNANPNTSGTYTVTLKRGLDSHVIAQGSVKTKAALNSGNDQAQVSVDLGNGLHLVGDDIINVKSNISDLTFVASGETGS